MNRSYHFPLVVVSKGVGTFRFEREGAEPKFNNDITGEQSDCKGVCITLEYFLAHNARVNPTNDPKKDYYIAKGYDPEPIQLNGCTSMHGALRYAEVAACNMFGRDESRGIVNRAVVHPYKCDSFKIDKDGKAVFKDAVMRNEVNATKTEPFEPCRKGWETIRNAVIGDSLILGGVIHSAIDNRDEKIKELEEQVSFLTGRLEAVSKAMRSQGEDVVMHAKVLRSMADALVNIWRNGK